MMSMRRTVHEMSQPDEHPAQASPTPPRSEPACCSSLHRVVWPVSASNCQPPSEQTEVPFEPPADNSGRLTRLCSSAVHSGLPAGPHALRRTRLAGDCVLCPKPGACQLVNGHVPKLMQCAGSLLMQSGGGGPA